MFRLTMVVALVLAAGCSSPQKKAPMLGEVEPDEQETPVEAPQKEPLVEAEGCAVVVEAPVSPIAEQRNYMGATEQLVAMPRQDFFANCGKIDVTHNWPSFFQSSGFDVDEGPNGIADATIAFMEAVRPYCKSPNGKKFRGVVMQVVFAPTEDPDRVGPCLDENKVLVVRLMMEPGSDDVRQSDAAEITEWLGANL